MRPHTLTARWLFPVSGPPLPNGTIAIQNGTILAVEPHGIRTADEDLGDVAIIPGLVNAHIHLDLSGARGLIPPTTVDRFTDWLQSVIAYRSQCTTTEADIRVGICECQKYGTTLVGDIAANGQSWAALSNAPMRAVVFWEAIGISQSRADQSHEALRHWLNAIAPTANCCPGVSPHAPYSVRASAFERLAKFALPMATHLAETRAEIELIERRTGPFVRFLQQLGIYDPDALANSIEQIVDALPAAIFAHGNYLPDTISLSPQQSMAYCPRTHAAFGHSPYPLRQYLDRGFRIALGTDSLASNPDLDVLAEARFAKHCHPDVSGAEILRMATLAGAESLGYANVCGSLEAGKSADLVIVPLPKSDEEPHELLLSERAIRSERRTMFAGQWRV